MDSTTKPLIEKFMKSPQNSGHTMVLNFYATIERCFREENDHGSYWTTEFSIHSWPSESKKLRGRGKDPVQIGENYIITGQLILDPGKEWEHAYLRVHVAEKIPSITENTETKVMFDVTGLILKSKEKREGKRVDVFYTVRDSFEQVVFKQTVKLSWMGEGVKVGSISLFRGVMRGPDEKDWVVAKIIAPQVS